LSQMVLGVREVGGLRCFPGRLYWPLVLRGSRRVLAAALARLTSRCKGLRSGAGGPKHYPLYTTECNARLVDTLNGHGPDVVAKP